MGQRTRSSQFTDQENDLEVSFVTLGMGEVNLTHNLGQGLLENHMAAIEPFGETFYLPRAAARSSKLNQSLVGSAPLAGSISGLMDLIGESI